MKYLMVGRRSGFITRDLIHLSREDVFVNRLIMRWVVVALAMCASSCHAPAELCPGAAPANAGCATDGLRCSYGDSVRPECRPAWTCSGGRFADSSRSCPAPPAGFCPAAPPAKGQCGTDGAVCAYTDATLCVCARCFGQLCQLEPNWLCAPPPSNAGCPAAVPNDGSACAVDGVECVYGEECSGSGATARCADGTWHWVKIACPTAAGAP
jgi:hypothetical protein